MNDQQNMTSSKIGRAAKLVGTGAKIGGNYLKYYAKKSVLGKDDKEVLHEDNAGEVDPTVYQQEAYVHQLGRAPIANQSGVPATSGNTIPILRSYHFHGVCRVVSW